MRFLATSILTCAALGSIASAQLTTYVYGSDVGDNGYNAACHGYSWEQAGFVTPRGEPFDIDAATGEIKNKAGKVIGKPIKVGDKVIGWRNNAKKVAVIDLTKGTLQDAFDLYKDNGKGDLQIMRHGGNTRTKTGDKPGGTIYLDNGKQFAGFGAGTGSPGFDPYAIVGPAGAEINLRLYNCFSANDPDGPMGPVTSVKASAAPPAIAGVKAVVGSVPVVRTIGIPTFEVIGGDAFFRPQVEAYLQTQYQLRGGFFGVVARVAAVPLMARTFKGKVIPGHFDYLVQNYGEFETIVINQNGKKQKKSFKLKWKIDYRAESPLDSDPLLNLDLPITLESASGGLIIHEAPRESFGDSELMGLAELGTIVDLDENPSLESVHLARLPDVTLLPDLPADRKLGSGIYELTATDGWLEAAAGLLAVDILPDADLATLDLYFLNGSTWEPLLAGKQVGPGPNGFDRIAAEFSVSGLGATDAGFIYTALYIPAPGTLTIGVLVSVGTMRRRR